MKKLIKQLASESVIYGLSGIITRLINVFLVPLYTRVLLPDDYGVLNLVNTTFYFVGIFVIFALDNSASRWFFDTEDVEERKKPIASWFWLQLAVSLFFSLLFILLSNPLSKLILGTENPELLIIPALTIVGSILPTIVWNWLRFQRRVWTTVLVSTGSVLLTIGLNVLFILVLEQGIKGILMANLISNVGYSAVALILMKDWLNYRHFSLSTLKQMLHYSLPLLPTSMAFWVLNSSASYFIKYYHTTEEVGLYSIGSSVASMVGMIVGAFQMAWGPFALSIMNKSEAKSVYSTVLTIYTFFAALTALTVALFAKEALVLLTTPQYYSAFLVSGILSFNAIVYGYAYIGVIGISIAKKTSPQAVGIMIGAFVTTVLYFIIIPVLGKEGAALSTLVGYTLIPVYVFYRAQKIWPIPYRFGPSILILVAAYVLFVLNFTVSFDFLGYSILFKTTLLLAFLLFSGLIVYNYYKGEVKAYWHKRSLKYNLSKA